MGQKRLRDAKQEAVRNCDIIDSKYDRIRNEHEARILQLENKIKEMETRDVIFNYVKQTIDVLNIEIT